MNHTQPVHLLPDLAGHICSHIHHGNFFLERPKQLLESISLPRFSGERKSPYVLAAFSLKKTNRGDLVLFVNEPFRYEASIRRCEFAASSESIFVQLCMQMKRFAKKKKLH